MLYVTHNEEYRTAQPLLVGWGRCYKRVEDLGILEAAGEPPGLDLRS